MFLQKYFFWNQNNDLSNKNGFFKNKITFYCHKNNNWFDKNKLKTYLSPLNPHEKYR